MNGTPSVTQETAARLLALHLSWSPGPSGESLAAALAVAGLLSADPSPGPESVVVAETARWRAGTRVPEHLYRDEIPVATMPAHVVAEIVEVMNEHEDDVRRAALEPCRSECRHPYESYWLRCGLLAPHEQRHENYDVGLRWEIDPDERAAWARGEL